jgi:peroxiredoxin family protein
MMASNALYILLCSGEHEKVQMAAMMASVAAVSERPVEVFVSMNAVPVFEKGAPLAKRYQGAAFSKLLTEKKAPDPLTLFRQGRELGDLKLWACSMALDVLGWELDKLEHGLFETEALGLTKFMSDAETGQFITL